MIPKKDPIAARETVGRHQAVLLYEEPSITVGTANEHGL